MTDNEPHTIGRIVRIFAVVLALIGIAYVYGGAQLAFLGGSPYFLITGIAVIVSAFLVWRGNSWGGWLYAAMLAWTWVWAVSEAGVDFWTLLPRLFGPYLFGLFFLTPWYKRSLASGFRPNGFRRGIAGIFALSIIGLFGWGYAAGDRYEQIASGPLPTALSQYEPSFSAGDWPFYGNDRGGTRFSPLTQISRENVGGLEVAWTYRTGEYPPRNGGPVRRFQATPLKVNGALFFCTSESTVIALDAATGQERWRSDAGVDLDKVRNTAPCRGVAYYSVPSEQQDPATLNSAGRPLCAARIIAPVVDARLRALDAETGEACIGFGDAGQIDLRTGMGEVIPDYYYVSSAPQIVRGRVVLGGRVVDGQSVGEPSGVIRAFDANTGVFSWAFDMGRIDDHGMPELGAEFTRGTPNSWAPISADEELGMVYLPIGNATPDFWGGHRRDFDNRFSSSVIALDAESGALRWSYQTVHYDLWDMDVAAQPSLIDLVIDGRAVPALVQLTKRGQTFVLDRRTGEPVFDVQERPVPQGGVEAARLSPTQPFSVEMPDFSGADPDKPAGIDETDMWGVTPFDLMWCRIRFRQARFDGPLTPPGEEPAILFPGAFGGVNWGSSAFDPERKILIANWSRFPFHLQLMPRAVADAQGVQAYDGTPASASGGPLPQMGTPYAAAMSPFLSPLGAPCTAPPYHMVTAVDLTTKHVLWSKRAGTAEDAGVTVAGQQITSRLPIPMGAPGIGGAVTTRSGLVFIAASGEQSLRAMDLATGDILWKARLPAGGNATPMTYEENGRQFVVIAAGGHTVLQTQPGDYIVAYALPDSN